MQTVVLGAAGLKLTPLAYGRWQFGGAITEKTAFGPPVGGPGPEGMS